MGCVGSAHSVWTTLGLPPLTACVLSRSTLLRLQVALQGNSPKQALGFAHFPGPSISGDQVLGECTVPCDLCILTTSPVPDTWFPGCAARAVCLLLGDDLWLWPSWQMSTVQDPRKTWLATGSLLTVWWRMPLVFQLWLLPSCLSASGRGRGQSTAG